MSGSLFWPVGTLSKMRVLAISVAKENPEVSPAQPLYDTLGRSEPGPVEQP